MNRRTRDKLNDKPGCLNRREELCQAVGFALVANRSF